MRMLSIVVVVACVAMSAPAVAQYHGGEDPVSGELAEAVRFNIDAALFRYASTTTSVDVPGAEDQTASVTSVGNASGFGGLFGDLSLGIGYALTDSLVLGSGMQFGYESLGSSGSDEPEPSLLTVGFAPYLEYMSGAGSTKPFIGGTLYVRHMAFTVPAVGGDPESKSSNTMLGGGLIGGAHFFVAEGCSVDLTGRITYGRSVSSEPELADGVTISELDVLVTLGVSAWIL